MRRLLLCLAIVCPSAAHAQSSQRLDVTWPTGEHNPSSAIVSLDLDDDDDDGVPDALANPTPDPAVDDEVTVVTVASVGAGALRVHTDGGVRLRVEGHLVADGTVPVGENGRALVPLVGTTASRGSGDASITFTSPNGTVRVAVTVVGVSVLHGDNSLVWAHRDAVRVSHAITNDDTLPRAASWSDASPDVDNLRTEVWDPGAGRTAIARIEALGTASSFGVPLGHIRNAIGSMTLDRTELSTPFRSRFVRLVGDDTDLHAPSVQGQTLLVGLRDRVHVRYRRVDAAGEATTDVRVGRPGNEDGPLAARRAHWHLVVLRDHESGRPMIGGDDASAVRIAREQVTISNEIYLQCMMTFGDPATYPVALEEPPENTLLAVADDDGLRAAGGDVRVRVGGRAVGPVHTRAGWRPVDTADAVARAIREAGLDPHVTVNRRTDYGADGSADILVRDARGHLVTFAPPVAASLTTDVQQTVTLGRVDFSDGLDEFNNLNSSAGTLEERTMIKSLGDDDPTSIELFIINRFTHQTRIGEAFVAGDGGAILNGLVIDRAGVAAQREAWTQSHEAGHIFLNQPWHPDNMGPDRPWLLMDADASLGAMSGPKRLEADECARITAESGVDRVSSLLVRYDVAHPSAQAAQYRTGVTADPYPRAGSVVVRAAAPSSPASSSPFADPTAASVGLRFDVP